MNIKTMLENISDSYPSFVVGVLTYVKDNSTRLEKVQEFMSANPKAGTSDILEFISRQDDFYEDTVCDLVEVI